MINKESELVEVPLDPHYLTEEGMYIAGYVWGRHVRSPKSAPQDAPEDFIRGVEDGYGSRMLEWEEAREEQTTEKNKNKIKFLKAVEELRRESGYYDSPAG